MDGSSRNDVCPQFFDLVPKERAWLVNRDERGRHGLSEENKLELRLGPPGEDWSMTDNTRKNQRESSESLLSLGYFSPTASMAQNSSINNNGNGSQTQFSSSENPVGAVLSSPWSSSAYQGKTQHNQKQTKAPSFLQVPSALKSLPVLAQEALQPRSSNVVELQSADKKAFSQSSAMTAVPNSSQKRCPRPACPLVCVFLFKINLLDRIFCPRSRC